MAAFPNNIDSARLCFDPSFYVSVFSGSADPVCQGQSSLPRMEESSKRRRFFSSPEEYFFDEEYYEEHLPEKKQRLSPEQVYLLEKSFEAKDKLEPEQKFQLARKLGLRPRQVAVWFQNRRARWKTKQLEWDYNRLKSSYDSLVSDYDSIIKENEKLKAKVFSLTEKLQGNEIAGPAMLVSDENNPDQHPVNGAGRAVSADLQSNVKVEDRVSTSSGGSTVVNEDGRPQLVSDDSYVRNDGYPTGGDSMVDGFQSDEDNDSDVGQCFFSNAFMVAEQGYHDDRETLNWWVWS